MFVLFAYVPFNLLFPFLLRTNAIYGQYLSLTFLLVFNDSFSNYSMQPTLYNLQVQYASTLASLVCDDDVGLAIAADTAMARLSERVSMAPFPHHRKLSLYVPSECLDSCMPSLCESRVKQTGGI